jgi:exopolysaccharide production protein ExoQ
MTLFDRRGFRLGFAGFVLFTGLAGESWRNLIGWYGYGVVVALVIAGSIATVVRHRSKLSFFLIPVPLVAFLLLATVSIFWSFYPLSSLLGITAQWATTTAAVAVAISLSWAELATVLGWVLRSILGLSFIFEFIVAVFFRHPIFPVWLTSDAKNPAKLLYWSRDLLFSGGKIQGISGNSALLAMIALIALIVFALQLRSGTVSKLWGGFWLLVALLTLVITQSATIYVAIVVVAIVAAAALVVRRAHTGRAQLLSYLGIAVVAAAGVVTALVLKAQILALLGKSSDLTGRIGIWDAVIGLAQQRPAFGWGWVSYWTPWAAPFNHLIRRGGVQVLHAHDAWLDVWLQLGILGLVVFGALVLTTFFRAWLTATDRIITLKNPAGTYSVLTMLPLLVLTAQLMQSITESRILIEGGWMLLVIFAVKTKEVISEAVP